MSEGRKRFEEVKDKVSARLINREGNREYLSDKPFTPFEDLAIVYDVNLGSKENPMVIIINDAAKESFDVSLEELHEIAMLNLAKEKKEFLTMKDMIMKSMGLDPDDPELHILFPETEHPMFVLSRESLAYGAAAILDKETQEMIAGKFGGDYIILPSSIHETIVVPKTEDMDISLLHQMVRDVNESQVAPEEQLSDHVYIYDASEKKIISVEEKKEKVDLPDEIAIPLENRDFSIDSSYLLEGDNYEADISFGKQSMRVRYDGSAEDFLRSFEETISYELDNNEYFLGAAEAIKESLADSAEVSMSKSR